MACLAHFIQSMLRGECAAPALARCCRFGRSWHAMLRANMRRQLTLVQRNMAFVVIRM